MRPDDLVILTDRGLFCPQGQFYIDPWKGVETALITHAHGDHARYGSQHYYATPMTVDILHKRLGSQNSYFCINYGERKKFGTVWVSLHPAGHVLGSAQVRIESGSDVWVVTGDYKRDPDTSCTPFEVVPCDTLISEATFALPIYDWLPTKQVAQQILEWWQSYSEGPTLLFAYSFGKAQRILSELKNLGVEEVFEHGSSLPLTEVYRKWNIALPQSRPASECGPSDPALVLAPPSAFRSAWMKKFKNPQTGFASGWMAVRGNKRRGGYERGFVLSDHCDWKSLIQTVDETFCKRVLFTHGYSDALIRYLKEKRPNLIVEELKTPFGDEGPEETFEEALRT